MVPPRAGDFVDERLCAVAVLRNQCDRHVAAREHPKQHCEGKQAKQTLDDRQRSDRPVRIELPAQMQDAEEQSEQRKCSRKPQRGKACLRDHRLSVCPASCSAA